MNMENQLTKELKAIVMRSGVVIWIEADRAEKLEQIITSQQGHRFFEIDGQIINTADITGVHSAQAMEELTRRKNGEWQCQYRTWHQKKDICECLKEMRRKQREEDQKQQREEDMRQLTAEEQKESAERFRLMDERIALDRPTSIMAQRFYKQNKAGRKIRRSTILAYQEKHNEIPDTSRFDIEEDVPDYQAPEEIPA